MAKCQTSYVTVPPPRKRPIRRATGKPGKIVRPPSQSIYEDTEFTPGPLAPVKRSISNVTPPTLRGPAPSQPPPRLGTSPIAIKKRPSSTVSSGGGSNEFLSPNRASLVSSSSPEDCDTYEPIQDFLLDDNNPRLSRMSITMDAPSYPAPPPPTLPGPNEDDNDGYTEVNLIPGGGTQSTFTPNKEWAELPLKTGTPQSVRRSPEPIATRLSSSPQSTGSSPGKVRILPPEPETPPPSPPMPKTTPTKSRTLSPLPESSQEGPKLPPKKQKLKNAVASENIPMVPNVAAQPDNVYFDHLVTGSLSEKTTPTVQAQDDVVYFDHLVENPPSKQPSNQNSTSGQVTSDSVYFDHLVTGSSGTKDQRSLPGISDDDVYELAGPPDEPPPRLPSKSDKPLPPMPTEVSDSVYDMAGDYV